jgi:TRAP-type transport system periplasmic protein
MDTMKSEVQRLSKNTLQIDNFPGNTLGGAFEQVDQIRTGQIEMAYAGLSFYDKFVPELSAAVLPFAAASSHQAIRQIEGEFGAYLAEKMAEKGVLLLGLGCIGARHVTNNRRPIKSVEDLRRLKIRTPSGEAWSLTFRAVGANPTPIDIGDRYRFPLPAILQGGKRRPRRQAPGGARRARLTAGVVFDHAILRVLGMQSPEIRRAVFPCLAVREAT